MNPKILVFFVAVFSQFIHKEITNTDKTIIVMVAGIIDTFWYVCICCYVTCLVKIFIENLIEKYSGWIDKFTGILLIGIF